MKRIFSVLLVLALLLVPMTAAVQAAETPTLSISSGTVQAGGDVTLTVSIADNPGIAATMLYIYYDTSVFTVDPDRDITAAGEFKSSGTLIGNSLATARQNGRSGWDKTKDGVLVLWFSSANVNGDGEILKITLHAGKDAPNGTYPVLLDFSQDDTCNEKSEDVTLKCSGGQITLTGGSTQVAGTETETPPVQSAKERLDGTIALQIDCFAAVADGALKAIDPDNHKVTPIINSDQRTMVPVRFVAETLGADVQWDNASQKVTITMEGKTVVMTIGSTAYTINGQQKTMDTAPVILPSWNRTMVPIRFVAEALGMAVEWDNANRLVLITPLNQPWDLKGEAEAEATDEILQLLMLRSFL